MAEQFLADGVEDFVSMGRSWLADEQWGKKGPGGPGSGAVQVHQLPALLRKPEPVECRGPSSRVRSESPDGSGAEVW